MKVLFVVFECENYSVSLFSSLLKQKGHEVHVVFDPRLFGSHEITNSRLRKIFDIRKNNIEKIKSIKPDLIGFSVYSQDFQWALEMAKMIKSEMDVPIIFGGVHCVLVPEEVISNNCIDIVCVSEGEYALLELVESMKSGNMDYSIKNLWFKAKDKEIIKNEIRPLIDDLDSLPFLDRDLIFEQKPIFAFGYAISTGRGCPYCCTFCVSEALNRFYTERKLGRFVRQRSVKNVMDELLWAKKKYNYKIVTFTDDVFTLNLNWLREFVKEYKVKLRIPFFCTANPGTIKDEEIYLLKEANCNMIGFGLQSTNEQTRTDILRRRGTNERIKEVSRLCHKLKICFHFDHIFNIPGEGIEDQVEALKFYNETRPDLINTFWMTYWPKIKLLDTALEKGILDEETVKKINRGETSHSLFVGVGSDYSFGDKEIYDTFAFFFVLLPLMPKWFFNLVIKKGWCKKKISVPFLVRLTIKHLARVKIGRFSEIFFPILLFLVNIIDNSKIKISDYIRPSKMLNFKKSKTNLN
ncbi:MAG: radical SAM protein [Candidatus Omnitrophica bacterium]|nr:radical SAM protein [Candidatus Omnitrophota bacterium]